MVYFRATSLAVSALGAYHALPVRPSDGDLPAEIDEGQPILHTHLVTIARRLSETAPKDCAVARPTLRALLRGSTVYIPPPPERPQSDQFKQLIRKMREREKAWIESAALPDLSAQPKSLFSSSADVDRESVEIRQQLTAMLNVIFSILGSAGAVWVIARHKSGTIRLSLSLGTACLVALAELVIYLLFFYRLEQKKNSDEKDSPRSNEAIDPDEMDDLLDPDILQQLGHPFSPKETASVLPEPDEQTMATGREEPTSSAGLVQRTNPSGRKKQPSPA